MTFYLSAIYLIIVSFTPRVTTTLLQVECDWQPYQPQFKKMFSLDIMRKNNSLVHISEGHQPVKSDPDGVVLTFAGTITSNKVILNATANIPCGSVSEIECELFGMGHDSHDYPKFRFKPKLVFDVSSNNPTITANPSKGTYAVGDVILFTCTTRVGVNASTWRWTVQHTEQRAAEHEFHPIPPDGFDVSTIVRSECSYQTTSKYVYIASEEGVRNLRCESGSRKFAVITITVGGHKEYLSTHLFLSSFLVYIHFIILPSIFAVCGDRLAYRKPSLNRPRRRTFRTIISFVVGVTFLVWWLIVICNTTQDNRSYPMFAVMEVIFIMFYTATRLSATLSRCFEKNRQRYLYNARVAASYAAVMTPTIFWTMIKCHGGKSILGLEITFWIFTTISFLGFVCVSKNREETYWEIVEKSES